MHPTDGDLVHELHHVFAGLIGLVRAGVSLSRVKVHISGEDVAFLCAHEEHTAIAVRSAAPGPLASAGAADVIAQVIAEERYADFLSERDMAHARELTKNEQFTLALASRLYAQRLGVAKIEQLVGILSSEDFEAHSPEIRASAFMSEAAAREAHFDARKALPEHGAAWLTQRKEPA